jgi:hypothetical protein
VLCLLFAGGGVVSNLGGERAEREATGDVRPGNMRWRPPKGILPIVSVIFGCWPSPTLAWDDGPVVLDGVHDVHLRGLRVRNVAGSCVEIKNGASNVLIEDSELGPCGSAGVRITQSDNVVLRGLHIHDTAHAGVNPAGSRDVQILESVFNNVASGVYALRSQGVVVARNRCTNINGPIPRGQCVQFDKVYGAGNQIVANVSVHPRGDSRVEDAINVFKSRGTRKSPIIVADNFVVGGGPRRSGTGILVGDHGGRNILVTRNVLVDPGQAGIGVAGGHDIAITDNTVLGEPSGYSNVGVYVWRQNSGPCYNITVEANFVDWTNNRGRRNPAWDGGGCGHVGGWEDNSWSRLGRTK